MTLRDDDLDALWERPLPPEEFERRLRDALASVRGPEGDELRDLIDWFMRRYPHPIDRIRYARRKYHEAMRFRGIGRP